MTLVELVAILELTTREISSLSQNPCVVAWGSSFIHRE
jgi:hypothetical protein